jgi:hypothetical protein
MAEKNDAKWELGIDVYVPILYQGSLAGFCSPEYSEEIVQTLNQEERLRKALRIACLDLLRQVGADTSKVDALMKKYMSLAERPKYGPRAVAFLLRERQQDLQVSTQEFVKFCDTFKVSPQQLQSIFAGKSIEPTLMAPIARILGKTTAEVEAVLYGSNEEE